MVKVIMRVLYNHTTLIQYSRIYSILTAIFFDANNGYVHLVHYCK